MYKLPQYQYDRLQKVLNAAARVTCLIPKFAHITPVLRELHWLPVKFRVEFKIALLVFKTLNGLAPQYLSELLVVKPRTRYSLRSDSETLLVIPKVTRKTFGDRAFFHAGPTVWNALPSSLRLQIPIPIRSGMLERLIHEPRAQEIGQPLLTLSSLNKLTT